MWECSLVNIEIYLSFVLKILLKTNILWCSNSEYGVQFCTVYIVIAMATIMKWRHLGLLWSAKCIPFQKPHANLPDTWANLSGISKFFLMLPDSTRAKHSTSIPCKSILSCYWNHLQLWLCIQNATGFDFQNNVILEHLRPQHRSVGDFKCTWKLCTLLWKPLYHIFTAVVLRIP